MRIFLITTLLFLSLLGYGAYRKATYETPPITDFPVASEISTETPVSPEAPTATTSVAAETIPVATPPATPLVLKPTRKPAVSPQGDTAAPSPLLGLEATSDDHIVQLSWFASEDNIGVKGYRIYRDKKLIGTTIETFYAEANVATPQAHTYTVYAFDNTGNTSDGLSIVPSEEGMLNTSIAIATTPSAPTATPTETATPTPTNTSGAASTPAATTPTPKPAATPTPAPTVSVTTNPSSIAYNATTQISWTSTNATSCSSANGGGSGTTGSFTTPALTTGKTYSVTCSGAGGSKPGSATVSVAAAPAPTPPPPTSSCGSGGTCTAADIASHNTRANCWVYLSPLNKAYNITAYVTNGNKHPGGDVIVPFCGKNMYNYFIGTAGGHKHSSSALNSVLQAYYIGAFQP